MQMKAFFLVIILAAAVLLGLKGNLAYKKKQIEKRARNMGYGLTFDAIQDKKERR